MEKIQAIRRIYKVYVVRDYGPLLLSLFSIFFSLFSGLGPLTYSLSSLYLTPLWGCHVGAKNPSVISIFRAFSLLSFSLSNMVSELP